MKIAYFLACTTPDARPVIDSYNNNNKSVGTNLTFLWRVVK
jgi:hypothetical protein